MKDGKFIYSYEGSFLNNKKEGYGVFTYGDGKVYKGHFQNDKRHGTGHFSINEENYYTGEWQNGKMHGLGKLISKNYGT